MIRTGAEYIDSLRGRNLAVYLLGERVDEPVDHPIIRPSINAVAATYDLAASDPELASAVSPHSGQRINRFLHIHPEIHVIDEKLEGPLVLLVTPWCAENHERFPILERQRRREGCSRPFAGHEGIGVGRVQIEHLHAGPQGKA